MQFFDFIAAYFRDDGAALAHLFCTVWRFCAPALLLLVLYRCARPLLSFRREPEIWAWLVMPDGTQLPVTHWESIIGRGKNCDIIVNFPTVSRNHAVLTRYDDGSWSVTDIGSRGAVTVNGTRVYVSAIEYGDTISLGGVDAILAPVTAQEVAQQRDLRTKPSAWASPAITLLLLTVFQVLTALQFWMTSAQPQTVVLSFLTLTAMEWLLFLLLRLMRRHSFEVETLAFLLTTMGLAVIASSAPTELSKQLICVGGGIVIYLVIGWSLRQLSRAKVFRYIAAVGGLLLLAANLVLGQEINGARNWIALGLISFQPSELVKLCFLYVGASTMDRVVTKRNLFLFIAYSVGVCGCLALMNDFGTALIFFVAFLCLSLIHI